LNTVQIRMQLRIKTKQLVDLLLDNAIIVYDWRTDEVDHWQCPLCDGETPVVFLHWISASNSFGLRPYHPCDHEHFPHTERCPIQFARHIERLIMGKGEENREE
jgi:hypothetical protein